MPLRHGMKPATIMHDLKHGPHHKDRTHKQEVAIMMKYRGKKRKAKGRR